MIINFYLYHSYYYNSNNKNAYHYFYNYYYNYYYHYYYYFLNNINLKLFLKERVEKNEEGIKDEIDEQNDEEREEEREEESEEENKEKNKEESEEKNKEKNKENIEEKNKEKNKEKSEEKNKEKNKKEIDKQNKNLSQKEKIKYLTISLDEYINKLINSKKGLYNAGGSCYMASIIQILIHSKVFLEEFLKLKNNNRNSLTYLFGNFIKEIANSSYNKKEISYFAKDYNKINYKFNGEKGNNPMTFFNEFIKKLGEENNGNILNIFSGKKKISFKGIPDSDYEEDFIFNLVNLDSKKPNIKEALEEGKQLEGDDNIYIWEEIFEKPKILIINLEVDKIKYKIEEEIDVGGAKYNLKAYNRYTNYHSIA